MGLTFNGKHVRKIFYKQKEINKVESPYEEVITYKVDTPTGLHVDSINQCVSWDTVSSVDYYEYQKNGGEIYSTVYNQIGLVLHDRIRIRACIDGKLTSDWTDEVGYDTEVVIVSFTNEYNLPWKFSVMTPDGENFVYSSDTYPEVEVSLAVPRYSVGILFFNDGYHLGIGTWNPNIDYSPFSTYTYEETIYDSVHIGDVSKYFGMVITMSAGTYRTSSDVWVSDYPVGTYHHVQVNCIDTRGQDTVTWRGDINIPTHKVYHNSGGYSVVSDSVSVFIPYGCALSVEILKRYTASGSVSRYSNWGPPTMSGDSSGAAICVGDYAYDAWGKQDISCANHWEALTYNPHLTVFNWYSG